MFDTCSFRFKLNVSVYKPSDKDKKKKAKQSFVETKEKTRFVLLAIETFRVHSSCCFHPFRSFYADESTRQAPCSWFPRPFAGRTEARKRQQTNQQTRRTQQTQHNNQHSQLFRKAMPTFGTSLPRSDWLVWPLTVCLAAVTHSAAVQPWAVVSSIQ